MGNIAKQFIEIDGFPAVYYSLIAFEKSLNVEQVIIVTRNDDIEKMKNIVEKYGFKKVTDIVSGGSTRDESVKNGFEKLKNNIKYVAINDAARPLITTEKIDFVFRDAYKYGAACACSKVVDTVKKADGSGFIKKTIPREDLYAAQTPQIFSCDIYRTALAIHLKGDLAVTDDCSMVENAGFKIKLSDIGIPNLKLTVPQDYDIIDSILKKRGAEKCLADSE